MCGDSLTILGLEPGTSTVGSTGSIPGRGTKVPICLTAQGGSGEMGWEWRGGVGGKGVNHQEREHSNLSVYVGG